MTTTEPNASIDELVRQLSDSRNAVAPADFPVDRRVVDEPGLYSWWADDVGRQQLGEPFGLVLPELIYAGQAGATTPNVKKERTATLLARITQNHLGGNINSSTFRRTLAALLRDAIPLELAGPSQLITHSNRALTEWMFSHLRVAVAPFPDRLGLHAVETAVLERLDPPLNLMGMPTTPVRSQLSDLRSSLGRRPAKVRSQRSEANDRGRAPARFDWLERVSKIRRWTRSGERAPHKPLLILYALGRLEAHDSSRMDYVAVEDDLRRLLENFGPPRVTTPSYPFRRLQNDGLWVVETATGADPGDEGSKLRQLEATGRFSDDFEADLRRDRGLRVLIARTLLEENWPASLHSEIAQSVGLDLDHAEVELAQERAADLGAERRRRDATFRQRVLVAYEYRCAFCAYDGRLENVTVGLDAAHVRWWALDGPDTIDNAVCLCTFHHRLLDMGVLGLSAEHEVTVSRHFVGHSDAARHLVLDLVGRPVLEPQPGEPVPLAEHVVWHREQVFRGPARVTATA